MLQVKWLFFACFCSAFFAQSLIADDTLTRLINEFDDTGWEYVISEAPAPELRQSKDEPEVAAEKWAIAADRIRDLGVQRNDPLIEARGLIRKAYVEVLARRPGENKDTWIEQCKALIGEQKNTTAYVELLMYEGHMTGACPGNEQTRGLAQQRLETAICIAADLQDDKLTTHSCNYLSEVLMYDGQHQRARNTAIHGLIIAESSGDESLLRIALSPLIVIRRVEFGLEAAIPYAERLLEIVPESFLARKVTAMVYGDDDLESNYGQAIARESGLEQTRNRTRLIGKLQFERAMILKAQNKTEEALELFEKAKSRKLAIGKKLGAGECDFQIAKLKFKLERPVENTDQLEKFVESQKTPPAMKRYSKILAEIFAAQGNHKKAAEWFERAITTNEQQAELDFDSLVSSRRDFFDTEVRYRGAVKSQIEQKMKNRNDYFILGSATCSLLLAFAFGFWRYKVLRSTKSRLEELVDQRTASLRKAVEKTELATKAKSDFLAKVNHEIRNPLTAIVASSELIKMEATSDRFDSGKVQKCVESLNSSTTHLLKIVEDVLDIGKIEQGHIALKNEVCRLSELSGDIEGIINELAQQKQIKFSVSCEDPQAMILSDLTRVKQIILNLADNAVKNTSQGFVRVDLSVRQKELHVLVEDSGKGIKPELQGRIFEPFYQVNEARSGVGLGLWIVKRIVNALGGTLELESQFGSGTKVRVVIPGNDELPQSEFIETNAPVETYKILVVDDKPLVRDAICSQLQVLGCLPITAETIEETLSKIEQESPEFVFLDLRMPDQDGFSYLKAIRRSTSKSPFCIAVTGDATAEIREKCETNGFDGFLTKPMRIRMVLNLLNQLQAKAVV